MSTTTSSSKPQDYGLLMPRPDLRLGSVSGRVIALYGNNTIHKVFPQPLVRFPEHIDGYKLDEPPSFIGGYGSGRRSALVKNGEAYKIRGCAVAAALMVRDYHKERRGHPDEPFGGDTLPVVCAGLAQTAYVRDMLRKHEMPFPLEPIGLFEYDAGFRPAECAEWDAVFDLIREFTFFKNPEKMPGFRQFAKKPVPLAASVFRINGDTRLDEIAACPNRSEEAIQEIAYRFGLMAGAEKRVLSDVCWGDNSNIGNYVIYEHGSHVYLSMVDFDGEWFSHQSNGLVRRLNNWLENSSIVASFEGYNKRWQRRSKSKSFSPDFILNFQRGFKEGLENPDKRKSVSLDLLRDAYELGLYNAE